jgi:hypothetical protein
MTQQNQLGTVLGNYMDSEMMLHVNTETKNLKASPYVNAFSETPDNGFAQFF